MLETQIENNKIIEDLKLKMPELFNNPGQRANEILLDKISKNPASQMETYMGMGIQNPRVEDGLIFITIDDYFKVILEKGPESNEVIADLNSVLRKDESHARN